MPSSISIEHIKKATDKRGGYLVNFQRSVIRGRRGSTNWKDIRFIDGKFEKWPGRWEVDQLDEFMAAVVKIIETKHEALEKGEKVLMAPEVELRDHLMRNIEELDEKTRRSKA